jgi:hypothetical protein
LYALGFCDIVENEEGYSIMKRMIESLLKDLIRPLLLLALAPSATALGSRIATGDWTKWFRLIPKPVWIGLVLVILVWVAIILIRKRLKQIRESDAGPPVAVSVVSLYGTVSIATVDRAGVLWGVHAHRPSPFPFEPSDIHPSSIYVIPPPTCPKCETELEESHSFWGGYVWRCVRCGFKKRNQDSFSREAERAERIARRKWQEMQEDKKRK